MSPVVFPFSPNIVPTYLSRHAGWYVMKEHLVSGSVVWCGDCFHVVFFREGTIIDVSKSQRTEFPRLCIFVVKNEPTK